MAILCLAIFGLMALPDYAQAQEQDHLTYTSLASALDRESQAQILGRLDTENIHVVDVEDIYSDLDDKQRQMLREMRRNVDTEALTNAIENSPTMKNALRTNTTTPVDARDVVAIGMQEDGRIVAYVDPNNVLKGRGMDDVEKAEGDWQDPDSSEAGDVQQWDEQQKDQDSLETAEAEQHDRDSLKAAETEQKDLLTFERLHSSMHEISTHVQALAEASDQRIRVVNVEEVTATLDDQKIQRLRQTHQNAETDSLHAALENNPAVMDALNKADTQVDVRDAVAVEVRDDGETIVYVDPNGKLESTGYSEK